LCRENEYYGIGINMGNKLSWEEIIKQYDKEWVELVDYDWPDGTPYPRSGSVRVHAPDRKEFYRLMKELEPKPTDSALVFVGIPPRAPNTIYMNPLKFATWK
jgi:hypothetical protein